ncbi:MAG: hypothetical protein ACTSXQ_02900 [Alphaproteobacteria bacterium]
MPNHKILFHALASILFIALLHFFIVLDALVFAGILTFLFIITQSILLMTAGDKYLLPALIISISAVALVFVANFSLLIYLFPIIMNLGVGCFFGHTLLDGKTPLITHFATLEEGKGNITKEKKIYTRRLTVLWVVVPFSLALTSFILAFLAPMEVWSLFSNIISYIILGTLFLGEHLYRYIKFKEKASPFKTVQTMADPQTWISLGK